ncbi:Diguanylate cyclase [Ignavibacterium album JCM 16511]|uniref:Diguanylate cyclase n=1 Tax=Ignavibacterium album (strain DSM 19864 / JCM 16511 / NBRC 101810 / Mat9-16) TaxID=945713 RepID=I0AI47_IGNAJ|nr:GAF domain-containing protein [Ignavibacterium album]AFH48654.1 Diguanylate cyclase [Ignavibacterium album JCM 16511]
MNKRQRKRLLIFLIVPVLAAILFFTDDLLIRVITIALMVIYVAFIIFLRDSIRFDGKFSIETNDELEPEFTPSSTSEAEESFVIVSKTKDVNVITAENYKRNFVRPSDTKLIPPDLKERFEEIAKEELPAGIGNDGKFAFALEKVLAVIKDAYSAHSALFFWYNKKKEKLSIEKFVSVSNDVSNRKFDVEDDILSKIVQKSEPELLSNISPTAEADVIRYYDKPQGIRSFVGVPLFYENNLIGILAMDSKMDDAFGIETIYSLGRFVRVITMIIQIFEEKHSDIISQNRLRALLNLIGPDSDFETEEGLFNAIQNSLKDLIEWDVFSFVYFKPVEKRFEVVKVINNTTLKYIGQGLQVDLSSTIIGKAVTTGLAVKIDEMSSETFKRFTKNEDLTLDGSFLAIPIVYSNQNFGVLCFESLKKGHYTNTDVKFLQSAVNIIAYIIYSHSSQKLLKSLIALDLDTRALNAENFKQRLVEDLVKQYSVKAQGALALIKIDDFLEQESLFDGDPFPKVLEAVAEAISEDLTPMTIFGRIDERIFAVHFFNTEPKTVYIWAEKLRVKVARKPVNVVSRQNTYTISIGVATTTGRTDADEVLENAHLALQKAVEKGGNAVRNIN